MAEQTQMPVEPELYVEPARMTRRDTASVIVALVALTVIGLAGYIWLTPGMSISRLLGSGGGAPQPAAVAEVGDTHAAEAELRCPYCGMFAENSMSHVIASWSDGQHGHYDSWDCVFRDAQENSLTLASAQVIDYNSTLESPVMLDARRAFYLYDTNESVQGSMPPYTAAFASRAAATGAQPELGGELVDFENLTKKWPDAEVAPAAAASESDAGLPEQMVDESAAEESEPAVDPLAHTTHDESGKIACPSCGMAANLSGTHIVAEWTDGAHHHYDCFDCMFTHLIESEAELARVIVTRYGTSPDDPEWLAAESAVFLYDTKRIKGSMPPFVAAFADRSSAEEAQADLGGEIVDWAALQAYWITP